METPTKMEAHVTTATPPESVALSLNDQDLQQPIKPGTDLDALALQAQGHEAALPRHFSLVSLFSFSFALMNSWIGFVALLTVSLTLGGPTTAFWTSWVAILTTAIVTLGLAELASAFPSTGGAYHFVFMLAPHHLRTHAAFVAGWFNILAYVFFLVSASQFVAATVASLAAIYNPAYEPRAWQVYLISVALQVLMCNVVIFLNRFLARMQQGFFYCSVVGFFVQGITILARSSPKSSAQLVFASWDNASGWASGFAFMLAVNQSVWLFSSLDAATHLAEEVPQPGKNVPITMLVSLVTGWGSIVFFSLAVLFGCNDFSTIATSAIPYHEAVRQGLRSTNGATFFTVWVCFQYIGSMQALIATAGRLTWAFARDDGVPFSRIFSRISTRLSVPVESTIAMTTVSICFGVINIGSTVAFNTFVSSSVIFMYVTATIPQVFCLFGARKRLPERYLTLPNWLGYFCNAFSLAWTTFIVILYCFPLYLPVEVGTMNYLSVLMCGCLATVLGMLYLGGKNKVFVGPTIHLEMLNAIRVNRSGAEEKAH